MRNLCVLVCLLGGCAAEPLYVYSDSAWTAERLDAIDDASALLGWELVPIDGRYGAIEIRWWDRGACGSAPDVAGCYPSQWARSCTHHVYSVPVGRVVAHEIGHARGLGHNDIHGDLMHAKSAGTQTFVDQAEFDEAVERFQRCVVTVHF